jgi:hypothetical protein
VQLLGSFCAACCYLRDALPNLCSRDPLPHGMARLWPRTQLDSSSGFSVRRARQTARRELPNGPCLTAGGPPLTCAMPSPISCGACSRATRSRSLTEWLMVEPSLSKYAERNHWSPSCRRCGREGGALGPVKSFPAVYSRWLHSGCTLASSTLDSSSGFLV